MEEPQKRRRTSEDLDIHNLITNDVLYLSPRRDLSPWSDHLFASSSFILPEETWKISSPHRETGQKRSLDELQAFEGSVSDSDRSESTANSLDEYEQPLALNDHQDRYCEDRNPFMSIARERHPHIRNSNVDVSDNYQTDGYVKINSRYKGAVIRPIYWEKNHFSSRYNIPGLPPYFGRTIKMDKLDSQLMKFFGVCSGRSLLPRTNGWLVVLCPMAEKDECIKHCLLAFASAYALELYPNERMRHRANAHYYKAINLLNEKLQQPMSSLNDESVDLIVAALRICWSEHIVNWELRSRKDTQWFRAVQLAKRYMAETDPKLRYWQNCNVQCSEARLSNANMAGYVDIMSQPMTPLMLQLLDNCHPWLLEGQKKETLTINGGTGLSPKLLHIFGQITELCVMLGNDRDSRIIVHGANGIEKVIQGLHQRSDLSEGYPTAEALLASNKLNSDGHVSTAAEVTNLTAEAWRQAALIYLRCRFYRLQREHYAVQSSLNTLLQCISRMPARGKLFTSQSPLTPIFLSGLVCVDNNQRSIVRNWFETVLSEKSKSSVPPLWKTLQHIWDWMDTTRTLAPDPEGEEEPIGHKYAWWEQLVEQVWDKEGRMSIV